LNQELESRVENRTRQLATANRELEAFCYSVSHDLRAPLRSVDGFSLALIEDYGDKLENEARDYLNRIRAASRRMGELIDDLLTLSRTTRVEMRLREVNMTEKAKTITEQLRLSNPERQVEMVIQPDMKAFGDPNLLNVVMVNLLSNAWKYTSKKPTAKIEFGQKLIKGEMMFFVEDDGAGFDNRFVEKLFQPFQRLHHPSEFEGHGIGLATVQRIVSRHGGRVYAEGRVGQGALIAFSVGEPERSARED
jgi:light-regulated signal transduction histidine kinase (bacteriophytochrome)